jgi:large subunit ribosomal protein L30|tara:strand:+ start:2016 stop:2369 length:354 start_codon:yes stop_codon:yes gene_type:complete
MICIIRIRGKVGLNRDVNETLDRLRVRKKYACVVLNPGKEQQGMIEKVKNFVAYGEIDEETYKELKVKRGKKDKDGKLKPFFRLHPPRKGINAKLHFPKGVLGNNGKKINDLVRRML